MNDLFTVLTYLPALIPAVALVIVGVWLSLTKETPCSE